MDKPTIIIIGGTRTGKSSLAYAIKTMLYSEYTIDAHISGSEDERPGAIEERYQKSLNTLSLKLDSKSIDIVTVRT